MKVSPHLARPHHRLETVQAAHPSRFLVPRGKRVPHHAHARHPAEVIPHGRRDHAARPHHAAHLGNRLLGFGNEMENEQRQGTVEIAVREREGAGVPLLDGDARICVAPLRLLDEDGREVDRRDLARPRRPWAARKSGCPCRTRRRGPARRSPTPANFDEWLGQLAAPAAHELLVSGGSVDSEARWHDAPPLMSLSLSHRSRDPGGKTSLSG